MGQRRKKWGDKKNINQKGEIMMDKKSFEKALKAFKRILPPNGYSAILRCVKLEGNGEILKIAGTNGKICLTQEVPSDFSGTVCVTLKEVLSALAGISSNDLLLEILADEGSGSRLKVSSSDGSSYTLGTFPPDEFPVIPSPEPAGEGTSIQTAVLRSALKRCFPFASDDTTRPYIHGVHMKVTPGAVRLEATDGHRLIRDEEISAEGSMSADFIAERSMVSALLDCICKEEGKVQIFLKGEHIIFRFGSGFILGKKPDCEFPPFDCVIPKDPVLTCLCDRQDLLSAVKQATTIIHNGPRYRVPAELHFSKDTIKVSVSPANSECIFSKSVWCSSNGSLTMGLHPRYLVDALEALEGEGVVIELTDSISGVLIKEGGKIIVVMPIRLEYEVQPVIGDDPVNDEPLDAPRLEEPPETSPAEVLTVPEVLTVEAESAACVVMPIRQEHDTQPVFNPAPPIEEQVEPQPMDMITVEAESAA